MGDDDYSELLTSIRERIRPVCSEMPQEEFDALTARMAEIEWKYAHRPLSILPPPGRADSGSAR